jgi:uncharacterized protein YceK
MKKALILLGAVALLAGCATDDPYANRGGTDTAPVIMRGDSANWGTADEQIPHLPGSTPGTHPSDPRGGTGADDFGGTDRGQRTP